MPEFTPRQRAYIKKRSAVPHVDPSEEAGELNIIPFLDIVVNLIMFLLMTTASVLAVVQIETELPSYGGGGGVGGGEPEEKLNLNITIVSEGVIVTGSGAKLAPGCENTAGGRVITVARKGDSYDWNSLTECVARVKKEYPNETQVIVSADPLIEYIHLVNAMDAVRKKDDQELFSEVLISGGVR